jgi:hypothetical protein
MAESKTHRPNRDTNPDPITGEPGAHPVGTGVGTALGGVVAGAAAGAIGGPAGAVVGAVVGGVAGGLAGKSVAESIDPTAEESYWQQHYRERPYYSDDASFEDYRPAYRQAVDARRQGKYGSFKEAEADLKTAWENARGKSKLGWDKAKHAARDAWDRLETAVPGDADCDGKKSSSCC